MDLRYPYLREMLKLILDLGSEGEIESLNYRFIGDDIIKEYSLLYGDERL